MSQEPEPIITYFRPGQLIFHINGSLDDTAKIDAMMKWANESKFAQSEGIRLSPLNDALAFSPPIVTQPKESQSYDGLSYKSPPTHPQAPFSLIGVNIESKKWPPPSDKKQDLEYALDELLELAIHLNENREPGDQNLVGVSPNWLMSGGPSTPGSTGGPGGRPYPYSESANTDKYNFDAEVEQVLQKIRDENMSDRLGDEKVVVAILDTAPTLEQDDHEVLDRIYETWAPRKHSLIKSLLGPNKNLRKLRKVYFDAEVDQPIPGVRQDGRLGDGYIQVDGHDYEMTDHGLFAAGIIHSLAPEAELHLFQVLNRYGVGDLLSIARALRKIHDDNITFPKNRLVVNLSLTINIPIAKEHGKPDNRSNKIREKILQIKPDEQIKPDVVVKDMGTVQTIAWICNSLYAQGAKVIAAAGNNGKSNHRPQACYPAAFESVLGVGALPIISEKPKPPQKKIKTASYSNRSDRPDWTGVTTLGGEAGKGSGVLGIYVGKFPDDENGKPQDNKSGWAWWAGTSFATPIIAGMTAAVRGALPAGNNVEDAVAKLLGAQQYTTENYNEDVLWVKQVS